MNCSEFQFPILSVSLLKNGEDIVYHIPANAQGFDYISVDYSVDNSVCYASLLTEGDKLIADASSFKLSNKLSTKQGGQFQQVTLEYDTSTIVHDSLQEFYTQQFNLRQNFYSLLIEFFDGTKAIVRTLSHGDGYLFASKQSDGTITNTITITNITGLQQIKSNTVEQDQEQEEP